MNKIYSLFLTLIVSLSCAAQQTTEKFNRAPVAVTTSQGILVSWRSLISDPEALTFDVYRNGTRIAQDISTKTNFLDAQGKAGDTYTVVTSSGEKSQVQAWESFYKKLPLKRPAPIKNYDASETAFYTPEDMTAADLDGDGDLELILKWTPSNARDNSHGGYTSPCLFAAYELDGTPMWSQYINLGYSVRSGAHYNPFVVYDFDGDGKAEMILKTGCDSRDAMGHLVSSKGDASIKAISPSQNLSFNAKGHVDGGEELLTVFSGHSGEALNTIWYSPSRNGTDFPLSATENSTFFGDDHCNRSERYNACAAYLDGLDKLPTAIMQRGYYTSCFLWAVDYRDGKLSTRWLHRGVANAWSVVDAAGKVLLSGSGKSSFGQGVHSISVGDVNNDGFDDIVIGSATIGHDGRLLCSTGMGHGDALHLTDLIPSRPGLEVMVPHESRPYGYDVHDPSTGEILVSVTGDEDNGRGLAGNFIPSQPNSVFWSANYEGAYDCATGKQVSILRNDINFRIYWTGDPYDQTFDGRFDKRTRQSFPRIMCLNNDGSERYIFQSFRDYGRPSSCSYTKSTPCLQADILGDWREEIIMYEQLRDRNADTINLLIYSTPEPTDYKVTCLMQDHVYRMGIVWQNSSYNQPPHLGYNLANALHIDGTKYQIQTQNHAP